MTDISLRTDEACDPQPFLLWDTVWVQDRIDAVGGYGDFALAQPDETLNKGGLQARRALHTAILIQLFTDKRLPDDQRLDDGSDDPRGWFGDSLPFDDDPHDQPLGRCSGRSSAARYRSRRRSWRRNMRSKLSRS